jgi:hypothetical protein
MNMNPNADLMLAIRRVYVERLQAGRARVGAQGTAALNRAIIRWLESCRYYNVAPPEVLIQAVTRQLKVDRRNRNEPDPKKRWAAIEACVRYPGISDSQLAQECDVSRPTIGLWKREDLFKLQLAVLRKFLEANPKIKAEIEANPHLTFDEIINGNRVKRKGR